MNARKKIVLLLLFAAALLRSQTTDAPKVGLCLSGGGAKGLAHIGLLKLIDSLGIKVDYITGTSMGSVVGGLYAAGYTGKQIDSLSHTVDWDVLLSQYVPMHKIWIDEKDEYGKYIGEIPLKDRRIRLTGFIEGQELLDLLSRLTMHVNHITDFNKLPIPFKCMAVNILTVKPVIMDHGNLAISIRASMSIPTIFKPVKLDDKLLVDGGLMVNFPVQQLKDMGADIIIGSYTGGRLLEEKEMSNVSSILIQTSGFYGINQSRDQIASCNILNNLTDNMKKYTAGDFKKANKIMRTGDTLAYRVLPQLVELANKQKAKGIHYQKPPLVQENKSLVIEKYCIDTVDNNELATIIRNRASFKPGQAINEKRLYRMIRRIYGTRNFFKTYYDLEPLPSGNYNLKFKVEQDVKFRIKGALHYDTELGSGFVLNVTKRKKGSRFLLTVDLAENPKYRLHYRKYLGESRFSFNIKMFREQTLQSLYGKSGTATGDYNNRYRSFNLGINYNVAMPLSVYYGFIGEISDLRQKFSVSNFNTPTLKSTDVFIFGTLLQVKYNTLNRFLFPRKGTEVVVENKWAFVGVENISTSLITLDAQNTLVEKIKDTTNDALLYNKMSLKFTQFYPVTRRLSFCTKLDMGFLFKPNTVLDSLPLNIPVSDYFFVGGAEQRSRPSYVPLSGLKEGEITVRNFSALQLSMQCEVIHNLFLTPSVTYFYSSSSTEHFFKEIPKTNFNTTYTDPDHNTHDLFYSIGLNIGYKTFIGPINLNFSKPSLYSTWRTYLSIGYRF